jgi:hypothetical protein
LQDGAVLIAGGFTTATDDGGNLLLQATSSAELFDPRTGEFEPISGLMDRPRAMHTATLLPNGQVLIVGGTEAGWFTADSSLAVVQPAKETILPSFIIYDPTARDFIKSEGGQVNAGKLNVPRAGHAAALVDLGTATNQDAFVVFVGGGFGINSALERDDQCRSAGKTYELFGRFTMNNEQGKPTITSRFLYCMDTANTFGAFGVSRHLHTMAVAKESRQVLIMGGVDVSDLDAQPPAPVIEVYEAPASADDAPNNPGVFPSISFQSEIDWNGEETIGAGIQASQPFITSSGIIFTGGISPGDMVHKAAIIASGSGELKAFPSLDNPRAFHQAAICYDALGQKERYLLLGGSIDTTFNGSNSVGIFNSDSDAQQFEKTSELILTEPRAFHLATSLKSGAVLVTGGWGLTGTISASAELINCSGHK